MVLFTELQKSNTQPHSHRLPGTGADIYYLDGTYGMEN